jgi:hypothetical protein
VKESNRDKKERKKEGRIGTYARSSKVSENSNTPTLKI